MGYIDELGKQAKVASQSLAKLGTAQKIRFWVRWQMPC